MAVARGKQSGDQGRSVSRRRVYDESCYSVDAETLTTPSRVACSSLLHQPQCIAIQDCFLPRPSLPPDHQAIHVGDSEMIGEPRSSQDRHTSTSRAVSRLQGSVTTTREGCRCPGIRSTSGCRDEDTSSCWCRVQGCLCCLRDQRTGVPRRLWLIARIACKVCEDFNECVTATKQVSLPHPLTLA